MSQLNNDPNDIINELEEALGSDVSDVESRESGNIPKGNGLLVIENAFLNRAQSGRPQLVASCKVLEHDAGESWKGRSYTKMWGLKTRENISWLKGDLKALEIDPPAEMKDMLRVADELVGVVFKATFVPNKEEQYPPNVFINAPARRRDLENDETRQALKDMNDKF